MVAKTDDEIYVLVLWKYIFTFHLKMISCWKYRKWCSYIENFYHHGKKIENKIFGQPLLHALVFQRRKYQVFWSTFGSCPLQLSDQLHYDCVRVSVFKYYQYYSGYLFAHQKRQLKLWHKMQSLIKLINSCNRTIELHHAGFFLKNLEHLLVHILVLTILFILAFNR